MQFVSALAVFLSKYSGTNKELYLIDDDVFKVGSINVGTEVVSSLGLRWIWKRFLAERMKDNAFLTRQAQKFPKPIREISQDITRLAMVL